MRTSSRGFTYGGSASGIPLHLTTGATDSYVRPVETVTINGCTVRVGSLAHQQLLREQG